VIVERLFASVRTVDNHLRQLCGKLGISSRAELVEDGDNTGR
jgi:DNA-binding CsgD family transcriptional regulator